MNLPNKLTVLRVILIPVFVFFFLIEQSGNLVFGGYSKYIAFVVFVIASLTDLFDGKIARKRNLVTNFGKFMDPLADKLLVCAALICMIETGQLSSIIVLVIIARDFIISGFRLVASDNGVVIAANMWGKVKTTVQMIMILVLILDFPWIWWQILSQILIWAALILTIVSLIIYLYQNKKVFEGSM